VNGAAVCGVRDWQNYASNPAKVWVKRQNGPGLRAVVYFQGCSLQCAKCWNPQTHKFRGIETTALDVARRFEEARRLEPLEGATFSGGEPMQQAEGLSELMKEVRKTAPAASLGMFTGYSESELASGRFVTRLGAEVEQKRELWRTIRELLDFAVMGRYDLTQPVIAPLRTSRNQRLVLFSSRYQEDDFGPQLVEISIEEGGKSTLTGFPVLGVPA
jgi:anaerobic ribonucleoside-triphosphate reductase activating protein